MFLVVHIGDLIVLVSFQLFPSAFLAPYITVPVRFLLTASIPALVRTRKLCNRLFEANDLKKVQ